MALTIIPNLLYTVIISIFVTLVLVMNSSVNVVYIILSMIIALIHVYVYLPYQKNKSDEMAEQELEIEGVDNQFQFRSVVNHVHGNAYKLGLFRNALTYIEIAVLLMSILTAMYLPHLLDSTSVDLYLYINGELKDNFIRLLQYSQQSEEYNNQLAKLLHYIDLSISNNSIE